MAEPNLKMSTVDYIVVALFMLVTLVIGLFASWKSSKSMTSKDMVIHKGMSLPSVVLSLTATFLSAILLVGTPAEVYAYGIEWLVVCLGYILALPIAVFTAVQTLYPLEISSIFEYFQLRFGGRSVRSMAAFLYAAVMMFYSGTALYAPIIAIASITDVPEWAGILIAGSICTLYTAVGGVRAVIWVDSFQFLVMLGSAVALAGFGSSLVGGVHQVIQISKKFHRTNLFEAVALNVPSMIMLTALACYCGLVVFANYAYCDPLLVDPSRKTDQIVPLFLVDKMRGFIGLPGLFIAGIFSGALSSVSSALNALAGIAWEDGLKLTVWGKKADESQKLVAIRLLGITFGIWAIFLAFICSVIGSTLLEINVTLNTTLCTPLIMMFFSSQFMPFVNKPVSSFSK
ncbi:unnamed protein product [Notodromas monacha]|uniref:Sodium-coupled monocarboxylate transporter 1 n=1 Tax=Notodromas monacha TaxID=399045 RepID=A0A7R9BSG1_9CRUS|nr:unnamed protein product [Notodromas monacha]CAG0920870.1 unnamed protein product [Notodromas monacha]